MEAQVTLGDLELPYLWKKSARRRTISITLHPEKGVVVHTPRRYQKSGVEDFLRQKARWIKRHLERMEAERQARQAVKWEEGQLLPFLGERFPLTIRTGAGESRAGLIDGRIYVFSTGKGLSPVPEEEVRGIALAWYGNEAARLLEARIAHYQPLLGVNPTVIRIKSQRRRWGSCSSKGALNFNWRLILAPREVFDYVVVHEMCHLKELNHSPRFWDLVAAIIPEYREPRKWLRDNGSGLIL